MLIRKGGQKSEKVEALDIRDLPEGKELPIRIIVLTTS